MSALRVSLPGQPVRLIEDGVKLTPRQEETLHWVRAYAGNRHRAARHLGISPQAVRIILAAAERAGARLPPIVTRRGILNTPKPPKPRCRKPMTRKTALCGKRAEHDGFCRSEEAYARKRTPERVWSR